jgi:golgin subfamily B member 1
MLISERSVLVLCQSIQDVDKLVYSMKTKQIKARRLQELKTGEENIDDRIDCGEIVIATNLAGRGADLKISETLNERGGLHVIISFMPINSRVEMQGRGRAGRNGYNGSSELAINYTKHCAEFGFSQQPRMIFENTRQSDPSFFCEIRDGL